MSGIHEPLMPEGVAGTGFEVVFQFDGSLLIVNSDIRDEFPWSESGG